MNDTERLGAVFANLPLQDAKLVSAALIAFYENKTRIRLLIEVCQLLSLYKTRLPHFAWENRTVDAVLEDAKRTIWQALMNGEYP